MTIREETRLDRAKILSRWHTKDPANDGVFVVGVLTTGIYCLPSCTARKPKDENVRFFEGLDGARRAGLRACMRCRPDDFYAGVHVDRDRVEALAKRVRERPNEFGGAGDLASAAGVGATKLNALFRRHYHTTPAVFLARARLATAAHELAHTRRRVLDVGLDAGYESSSAFHEGFQARYALTPGAYRRLGTTDEFTLQLPQGYRDTEVFSLYGRDAEGCTERVEGRSAFKALLIDGKPAVLELELGKGASRRRVRARVRMRGGPTRGVMLGAHSVACRALGLGQDPGPFERRMRRTRGLARLVRGRLGLRIPQTADAFEGLVWVIVGQQVNVTFAATCRSRLIDLAGHRISGGFVAHPTPAEVAALDPADLLPLQYSRRKAEYLVDAARAIAAGELDLEGLRTASAERVEETLLAIRGLGPWSAHYLLMRSFGFEDCVPVGDAGLVKALAEFFELPARPDAKETLLRMEVFAPHRSLATFHLWRSLGDVE